MAKGGRGRRVAAADACRLPPCRCAAGKATTRRAERKEKKKQKKRKEKKKKFSLFALIGDYD